MFTLFCDWRSGEVMLTVTQHSHCEYWLNAFAHILGVEFGLVSCGVEFVFASCEVELGLTGLTSTSRNVRRTLHVPSVVSVQCFSPERSPSYPNYSAAG